VWEGLDLTSLSFWQQDARWSIPASDILSQRLRSTIARRGQKEETDLQVLGFWGSLDECLGSRV
jgi:hypothetical protein